MAARKKILLSLSTSLALSVCLFLSLALYTVVKSLDSLSENAQKSIKLELFFNGQIQQEVLQWADTVKSRFEVQDVIIIDQSEAQKEFVGLMKADWGSLVEDKALLDTVPSSVIVQFQSGQLAEKLARLSDSITQEAKSFIGFDTAIYQKDWAQWLTQYQGMLEKGTLVFFILITFLVFLVVSNLNRSLIFQSTKEIEVKYLVGATHWQISTPFIFQSCMMGTVSVFAASAAWDFCLSRLHKLLSLSMYSGPDQLIRGPNLLEILVLFAFVILVCGWSAENCVREQVQ